MKVALTLLNNSARVNQPISLPLPDAVASRQSVSDVRPKSRVTAEERLVAATMADQPRIEAEIAQIKSIDAQLAAGTLSPLSVQAATLDETVLARVDRGAADEGWFAVANSSFAATEASQAAFPDRQVAMLNAYHYGSALAASGKAVADLTNTVAEQEAHNARLDARVAAGGITGEAASAYKEQSLQAGSASSRELASAERAMDRAAAMLKSQFGFTSSVVQSTEDGGREFLGFEVRHDTYGLLMSFDADGAVTLYDGSGKGYAADSYNASNPDAAIPELDSDVAQGSDMASIRDRILAGIGSLDVRS